ncbi:EAL domain-containing protein [Chromatiaceae bacterium AAb-1]|nr:EAL domain-containing protein [Chromatiaceae bacterium AAb-1]
MKFRCRQPLWLMGLFFALNINIQAATLLHPLTPDQGLTQGSVRDLYIDQQGFLWIATNNGLNRFDSSQVIRLSSSKHHLKELTFSRVLEDSHHRIWAAAANAGIYQYDPQDGFFELFMPLPQPAAQQRPSYINELVEYDGDTLLFTMDDSLYRLPLNSTTPEKLFSLSETGVSNGWLRTLFVHQQHVFIGASSGLIHFDMNNRNFRYLPHIPAPEASADQRHVKYLNLYQDRLWVGTVEGLYSIAYPDVTAFLQQGQPYRPELHIAERNIWNILWRADHAMVATDQGLYRYLTADNTLQSLLRFSESNQELTDNNIIDIAADSYGGYWLASRDHGAYYWHPRSNAFSHISSTTRSHHTRLSSDKIYALGSDRRFLWAGTANGLNKLDLATNTTRQFFVNDDPKAVWHSGRITNLFPESDTRLWFSSASGLNYFDTVQETLLPLPNVTGAAQKLLQAGSVYYYQHQGNFYFATANNFFVYNPESGTVDQVKAFRDHLKRNYYSGILGDLPDDPQQMIVGAADQLWLYDPRSQQLRRFFQYADYMPELQRRPDSIIQDKNGILWVGFPGLGLLGFDHRTLALKHRFSSENKLVSDAVYALQEDSEQYIWFSSHQGLARLNPDTLQIEQFSKADGLLVHEHNGRAGTKLPDGRLAFGNMRGITLVDPQQLVTDNQPPRVVITDIGLVSSEKKYRSGNLNEEHITLSHDDLGIQLQFSSLNFRDSHKMRYRFWLQGPRTFNYPEQSSNQVIFPQLDSGRYVFNVVAISPVSGLESKPARLFLHVKPAPWLTPWALMLYVFITVFLFYRFYSFRRKQNLLLRLAHNKIKVSEQRMKQALESVNSGAWEWQASHNALFASRIHTMLGYPERMNPLTLQQHLTLIHPDDTPQVEQHWLRFQQNPEQGIDCTYRLRHKRGQWLWFRDQGKATDIDDDGRINKVMGTFSNITETRANLEKAKLFGEAFQQTRDWVVILDAQQRVIAANQSFSAAFGSVEQYLEQPRPHHLGISLTRRRFYARKLKELQSGEHWQGEERIITPDGRERPTLLNISAVGDQQVSFFVLVFTDITAQKMAEDELRYLANYDTLTGLPNRALLMDRIYHGIEQAKREKRSLALCFIDLDKFKQINDSLGHDIGDLLLKEVARRLSLTLRESDTIARLGGDEFVVLLEGYKNEDNISHVARKMLSIVSEPMQLANHTVGVSPSIGIAVYPNDALNGSELLKHADVAMYHAKEAGRNNFQFFTAEMNEKAHMQLARETRLRKALQQKEFINYYQPIINVSDNSMVGAEVLLRWQSSSGMISPSEFIPLAEELRLIINMTQQLLERALADLQQWWQAGHQLYLSVNLSTRHLEQPALAEHTRILLEKYQLPPHCLRFEVTESALMRDHQSAIETMLALNKLGIQLALDDFGTGYSSLKYLKELPIDAIKIDRSFVQDIGIDSSDETIIDAMLSMASSLGMYCVAEGVETEQQLAFFMRRQCYLIQGYLFAKPMPAQELSQLLAEGRFKSLLP